MRSTACSSVIPSGILSTDASAAGTATASAWPPHRSSDVPNTVQAAVAAQRPGRRPGTAAQRPQPTTPDTSTRSPARTSSTSAPTSSTVPTNSWPRWTPGIVMGPWYRCRSEPQIAVRSTRSRSPSGPGTPASGTSSTRMSSIPCNTTARMAGDPRGPLERTGSLPLSQDVRMFV